MPRVTQKNAREAFLDALRDGHAVKYAAEIGGRARKTFYEWRKNDPEFAQQWDDAVDQGTDELETEARRRALDGSDTLLIFLMKARRPHLYRDNVKVEHAGSKDAPIVVEHRRRLTLDDVYELAQSLRPGSSSSVGGEFSPARPVLPDP